MSQPFQFSMRRMFGTVALLAVTIRMLMFFLAVRFDSGVLPPLLFIAFFTSGGAAIGCFEGKTLTGAKYGGLLGAFFVFLWLLTPTEAARE